MGKNEIINRIIEVAKKIFPNQQGEVYLFGSQARGDSLPDSDWDLLILTDENLNNQDSFNKYIFPFSEIGWYLNVEINPIGYSKQEWDKQRNPLFYQNVVREAIKLYR